MPRRAIGRDRFEAFVAQVGRQIAGGTPHASIADRTDGAVMSRRQSISVAERRRAMLRTAMGPAIAAALADPRVIEIMVNPDGALRLDRLGEGRVDTGVRLDPAQVERIIRLVASHARAEVHGDAPIVSAELPPHGEGGGERFEGVLPPVSTAPCFSIRKPAARIYTLDRLCDRRHHVGRGRAPAVARGRRAPQHPRRRRHQLGQDDARQRAARRDGAARRARDPDRGHARAAMPGARHRRAAHPAGRRHAWPIWCARRCACAPTGSSSARCAAPRRSTCSRPGTPAIPAASPPSMPTARASALYRIEQLVQEAVVTVPRRLIAEAIDIDRLHRRPRHRAPHRDDRARRRARSRRRLRRRRPHPNPDP